MRKGSLREGELWMRCPHCGDSPRNLEKAHYHIQLSTGKYFCYRCQTGGILSIKEYFQLLSVLGDSDLYQEQKREMVENPGELLPGGLSGRSSLLPRFHFEDWEVFKLWDPRLSIESGYYCRKQGGEKLSRTSGSGWGWFGAPDPLRSSMEEPLRVVEGPYDVRYREDISSFGLITMGKLRDLEGHFLILCPDGDIWLDEKLRGSFLRTLRKALKSNCYLSGIEVIPGGKDPDETTKEERIWVPRGDLPEFISQCNSLGDPDSGRTCWSRKKYSWPTYQR